LLTERRGVPHPLDVPRLSEDQIVAWADAHRVAFGEWPNARSGPIVDVPGETWVGIDCALYQGGRGLPGGSSLARLLQKARGARNAKGLPPLTEEQILAWADAYHVRTGHWPKLGSGAIPESAFQDTWAGVDRVLRSGDRGLARPGGAPSSLARLLH
jgi:hypothetical protein